MIRVIAFDLDDTLWHVDPVIRRAESKLKEWLESQLQGFVYDRKDIGRFRQAAIEESPHLAGRMTEFRRTVLGKALSHHGVKGQPLDETLDAAMEVFLAARNDIEFFEGALETIAFLSDDFLLGALSNGNADVERLGLANHFSFAFSAEEVGAPKPAPDLFHAALAHTGCGPDQMVYVGDDPVKDVDAANRVGLRTIWLKNALRPGPGASDPDIIIEDIRQLPDAIMALDSR